MEASTVFYSDIHLIFKIFISFSRHSSYSRYSLSNLCGNKRYHQTQAGGNADGDAETGSLSKPSDNRWSYKETEEADARNDGDGNARLDGSEFSCDAVLRRLFLQLNSFYIRQIISIHKPCATNLHQNYNKKIK